MYKVYINSLLTILTNHCYAIFINRLSLSAPLFADDIALLALYPTFLTSLMGMCYMCSTKCRYEFNRTKSGVVTYDETKPAHFEEMKECEWIGSFSSNVEDSIDKTWKKAGMIFSSNFDRRKVDPFFTSSFGAKHVCPP